MAARESISLTAGSARIVRYERIVAAAPNSAEKTRLRGYYDVMLGLPLRAKEFGKIGEVSYAQGAAKAHALRSILNGSRLRANSATRRPFLRPRRNERHSGLARACSDYRDASRLTGGMKMNNIQTSEYKWLLSFYPERFPRAQNSSYGIRLDKGRSA